MTEDTSWVRACGTRKAFRLEQMLKALEWQVKVGEKTWEQVAHDHKLLRESLRIQNQIYNRNYAC